MGLRTVVLSLVAAFAVGSDSEMWGPADSVKAFGALETALDKITSIHMSDAESKHANKVAADVRSAIALVEGKSNLTKAQKNEKIGVAVKELMELQAEFKPKKQLTEAEGKARLAELEKEMAAKKELLAKEESMIKLYTLQKQLAEKKLQLQNLIAKKEQAEASKKSGAADTAEETALVGKLMKLDFAKADMKAALTEVKSRAKKESDELSKMEASNKKAMADLDSAVKKMQIKGGEQMIHRLKKQEQRSYKKLRVQKQAQLNELKTLEESIEKKDSKKFTATLKKMEHETKALTAQSGDFLH